LILALAPALFAADLPQTVLYGVIIFGWGCFSGGHSATGRPIALSELRTDLWMGGFMTIAGAFYTWKFAPRRKEK
jgi:hypothetical protein